MKQKTNLKPSSRSVRDKVKRFVEKHPKLITVLGSLAVAGIIGASAVGKAEPREPPKQEEKAPEQKKEAPKKEEPLVVADSKAGSPTASSGKSQAGPDPLEGSITVDALSSLEKPRSDEDIGETVSRSKYVFKFKGHTISFVTNICYNGNSGCNSTDREQIEDVSFALRIDNQPFLILDYGAEREQYERENPGKKFKFFHPRIALSGDDAVIHLVPNGEIREGNFDSTLTINPDFRTNGRKSHSFKTLRIGSEE